MPRSKANSKNSCKMGTPQVPCSRAYTPRAPLPFRRFGSRQSPLTTRHFLSCLSAPTHPSAPVFHGSQITGHESRFFSFRFATHRKTGIPVTPSKQTIGLFPVRNKSRDFDLSNFCAFRCGISPLFAPTTALFPTSRRPSLLKISLSSPTQLQDTCANVFPHIGRRESR